MWRLPERGWIFNGRRDSLARRSRAALPNDLRALGYNVTEIGGDSWKVKIVQEGSVDDADRREMVEQIAARLKGEYDLKG